MRHILIVELRVIGATCLAHTAVDVCDEVDGATRKIRAHIQDQSRPARDTKSPESFIAEA